MTIENDDAAKVARQAERMKKMFASASTLGGRVAVQRGGQRAGKTAQLLRDVSLAIADIRPPEYARVLGDMAVGRNPIYITPEFYETIKDMDIYADALASGQLVVMKELPKL